MNWLHLGLAGMMLVTGSINTISVKWADTLMSESSDGIRRYFHHPFLQAAGMFLGEIFCLVAFVIIRWYKRRYQTASENLRDPLMAERQFNPLLFWLPAICDMCATSIQYIGLTLTYASSFQMLRGAVIVFTGIMSRVFLKRKLGMSKWVGIVIVIAGLSVVGLCDMVFLANNDDDDRVMSTNQTSVGLGGSEMDKTTSDIILGDVMIVGSQVLVAGQMVLEEKLVGQFNVPALQAVGWEGVFGFSTLSVLLIPFYFIKVGPEFGQNPRHVLEDAYDGLYQLGHNPLLLTAFCGTIISIAFFNFAGISVTKAMSATTRMVLDSMRTLVIWGITLLVGWQRFHPLQLLGFTLLVSGMCVYNDLLFVPAYRRFFPTNNPQPLNEEEDGQDQQNDGDDEPTFTNDDDQRPILANA